MFINGIPFILSIDEGKAKIDKTYDFSAENILLQHHPFDLNFYGIFSQDLHLRKGRVSKNERKLSTYSTSAHITSSIIFESVMN